MRTFGSIAEAAGQLAGCAAAIGNFDGVHAGHRALFAEALRLARAAGSPAVALTFWPHPARVLRPDLAPRLLTPLAEKLRLIAACGLDAAVVQPFDLAYAKNPAAAFVERDLVQGLGVKDVVVGHDFTAGHDRARPETLRPLLEARGARLHVLAPVSVGDLVVSSTKVRELLLEGNAQGAALLLGRPYAVVGTVVRGAGRGRGIGFPTANVDPGPPGEAAMLPAAGVYAVRGEVGGRAFSCGACNIGVKPTVAESSEVVAEVHVPGLPPGDLYGQSIRVEFLARLRSEQRFASLDALKAQIARDVEAARRICGRAS